MEFTTCSSCLVLCGAAGLVTKKGEIVDPLAYKNKLLRQERRDQLREQLADRIVTTVIHERRLHEARQVSCLTSRRSPLCSSPTVLCFYRRSSWRSS